MGRYEGGKVEISLNLTLNHNLTLNKKRVVSRGSDTLVALLVRLKLKSDRSVASTTGDSSNNFQPFYFGKCGSAGFLACFRLLDMCLWQLT